MSLHEAILAHSHLLLEQRADRYPQVGEAPGLCVGFVPGVMPGKWVSRWRERYGALVPLVDVALAEGQGLAALDAFADLVLLRGDQEPVARDTERYHAIELYRETPVVVLPKDHLLTVLESVPVAELADEVLLQNPAHVPGWAEGADPHRVAPLSALTEIRHQADAFELVAAGLGLLIVPLSVARINHRKDLTYRPLEGGESYYPVLLVWKKEPREDAREQIIQDFVGITRGRTAASHRGSDSREVALEKRRRDKEEAKRKRVAANKKREAEDRKRRRGQKSGKPRRHGAQKKTPRNKGR
ncbi:LysR substrate-binding domain-containing protein [Rothia nasimurium]|nr:LysR substrate-binding domain-containing protein [Rothia nasimurium]